MLNLMHAGASTYKCEGVNASNMDADAGEHSGDKAQELSSESKITGR
jgi:hypothetical protein